MPKLRAHNFAISLDGYGAGPNQNLEQPLGEGGRRLHMGVRDRHHAPYKCDELVCSTPVAHARFCRLKRFARGEARDGRTYAPMAWNPPST